MDLGGELIKAYLFQQHSRQTGSPSGTDIYYNLCVCIYLTALVVCSPEGSVLPKSTLGLIGRLGLLWICICLAEGKNLMRNREGGVYVCM